MAAPALLLHHPLFKPSLLILKPLCCISTVFHLQKPVRTNSTLSSPSPRLRLFSNSSSSLLSNPQTPSCQSLLHEEPKPDFVSEEEDVVNDKEGVTEDEVKEETQEPLKVSSIKKQPAAKLPVLSIKEKKELASYAHSLGKKLKSQQVGKSGITDSVAASFVENLEKNELLKLKIHNSCPGELVDVVRQLEQMTGSVAVGQIGRSVILYRPSLTKLKAEEKKNSLRRMYTRKPPEEVRLPILKPSGRGHRGSSRVTS